MFRICKRCACGADSKHMLPDALPVAPTPLLCAAWREVARRCVAEHGVVMLVSHRYIGGLLRICLWILLSPPSCRHRSTGSPEFECALLALLRILYFKLGELHRASSTVAVSH